MYLNEIAKFHKEFIWESLIFPNQYGNYTFLIFLSVILIFLLIIFRKDLKKINKIYFIFIVSIIVKATFFYTPISSCSKIDTDGYTHISKWISANNDNLFEKRIDPNLVFKKNEMIQRMSIVLVDNKPISLIKGKIYKQGGDYIKIKNNLTVNRIFSDGSTLFFSDQNNSLYKFDKLINKYENIYNSKIEITSLQKKNNSTFISLLNGDIININSNNIFFKSNLPIYNFFISDKYLYLNDFYNRFYFYNLEDAKPIKKINLSSSQENYTNIFIDDFDNTNLFLDEEAYIQRLNQIEEIFLSYSNKGYEIKNLIIQKNNIIFFFHNGKFKKFSNLVDPIKILRFSKNIIELEKNLNLNNVKFFWKDIILNDNKIFSNNVYGDNFTFNLINSEITYDYNNDFKVEYEFEALNLKVPKDSIRLPGYPLISSYLMKITNNYNACNIVFFQHILLVIFLISVLSLFKDNYRRKLIIFSIIIISDPTNYLMTLTSMDNPHFFEMLMFSIYLFFHIFKRKKIFELIKYFIIIISSFISTKILLAIFIFHTIEIIFNLLNSKLKFYKIISLCFVLLFIFINLSITNFLFKGQSHFNKTNINQKFISYLMFQDSEMYQINEVNEFKKRLGITIENKITYKNHWIDGTNRYPAFSNILSGFTSINSEVDYKPILNLKNNNKISTIDTSFINLIYETKFYLIYDLLRNSVFNIDVLFSISDFQKSNKLILWLSFIIFIIGIFKSKILYKDYYLILFFSFLCLYIFYALTLVPQSRFMSIYTIYLYSLYFMGILEIKKIVTNFLKTNN